MLYYAQINRKESCALESRMCYVRGHVEVYDARGTFLFSADNEAEAERMLEE